MIYINLLWFASICIDLRQFLLFMSIYLQRGKNSDKGHTNKTKKKQGLLKNREEISMVIRLVDMALLYYFTNSRKKSHLQIREMTEKITPSNLRNYTVTIWRKIFEQKFCQNGHCTLLQFIREGRTKFSGQFRLNTSQFPKNWLSQWVFRVGEICVIFLIKAWKGILWHVLQFTV